MNLNTISVTSSSLDEDSQSTSSSLASGSSRSSNPPLDSPTEELITTEIENSVQRRFFPRGTKMYMLLCVNTSRRLIKLANVDVTDMDDDEKVFNKLREAYGDLRKKKWYSRLVKPKTMHYIKVSLFSLNPTSKNSNEILNFNSLGSCTCRSLKSASPTTKSTLSHQSRKSCARNISMIPVHPNMEIFLSRLTFLCTYLNILEIISVWLPRCFPKSSTARCVGSTRSIILGTCRMAGAFTSSKKLTGLWSPGGFLAWSFY
ncbi:hypothetical protein BGZ61DRAFT_188254 [Ilyonectria robusta]|uniref:uncharacterized protein n=1 Tax=Ilyonectria robusta TaxID=1079257 RepID=UPI001E8D3B61|nr:uncharacterized protein BGZ61DRAFT_188254 [Ilyonectria robusta]KAH8729895.1 hypothetical protein BGZ61DRAFT_188254 [Ilyonectria robusta]